MQQGFCMPRPTIYKFFLKVMGGAVSAGNSNDELVDNLVKAGYIKDPLVERIFRNVDRGHFYPEKVGSLPYRDVAWRQGNVHISAPCIYCEVIGNIELKPGLTFLNIGSGTGYLSTLAGMMQGIGDINHGVEIHEDVLEYGNQRVSAFVNKKYPLDEFEFCRPQFVCGNGLMLPPETQYDRIYCGAACNEEQLDYLKGLIKLNGILITPIKNELMKFTRIGEDEWTDKTLLPVSFSVLIPITEEYQRVPVLPNAELLPLEEICRGKIRSVLRSNVIAEHPIFTKSSARIRAALQSSSEDTDEEWETGVRGSPQHPRRLKFDSGVFDGSDTSESQPSDSEWSSESSDSEGPVKTEPKKLTFSDCMQEKIRALELPKPLLQYLNLGRSVEIVT